MIFILPPQGEDKVTKKSTLINEHDRTEGWLLVPGDDAKKVIGAI